MVLLPDGSVRFVNVELEPSVIKDILERCDYEGSKIYKLRDAYSDTLRNLGNLAQNYDDPDQIIEELQKIVNEELNEKLSDKRREILRRMKKSKIMDKIDKHIEASLDNIKDYDDINVNVGISEPEMKREEPEILHEEPESDEIDFVYSIPESGVEKMLKNGDDKK